MHNRLLIQNVLVSTIVVTIIIRNSISSVLATLFKRQWCLSVEISNSNKFFKFFFLFLHALFSNLYNNFFLFSLLSDSLGKYTFTSLMVNPSVFRLIAVLWGSEIFVSFILAFLRFVISHQWNSYREVDKGSYRSNFNRFIFCNITVRKYCFKKCRKICFTDNSGSDTILKLLH